MADEVRLRATKDIPKGFKTRPAGGGAYHTRMLKAGDEFYTAAPLAKFFVHRLKRAEQARAAGKVPPPPASVMERAGSATPTADEAFAGFLDRSIPKIAGDLPGVPSGTLKAYLQAEKGGKSRRGLIVAIEAELDARKG